MWKAITQGRRPSSTSLIPLTSIYPPKQVRARKEVEQRRKQEEAERGLRAAEEARIAAEEQRERDVLAARAIEEQAAREAEEKLVLRGLQTTWVIAGRCWISMV